MKPIVKVKNLEKSFQSKKAVNGLSFELNEGEILGLLGPNGAGKSTTINILSTILAPDKGEVTFWGHHLSEDGNLIKNWIGIVPQEIAIFEDISTEKNVRFFGGLYGLEKSKLNENVKEALEFVGLYDKKDELPKTFSGGMKRRLNIACALVHQPRVLIMDEPTVGIDPQSRNHILESIKLLQSRGMSIIYSTHYMEEVEAIANQIIIMSEGHIIAEGTKEELIQSVENEITYTFEFDDLDNYSEKNIIDINGVIKSEIVDNKLSVTCEKSKNTLNLMISKFFKDNLTFKSMGSKEASLETVFLDITGRSLKD